MPSYLDFESSKNGKNIPDAKTGFRDFLLAKTLKRTNGPQTFTANNYIEQNTSDFPNKDVGGIDSSENFELSSGLRDSQKVNTFKPLKYMVKEEFVTLPRRANLNLYPYFQKTDKTLISIITASNFNGESELAKFAANYTKYDINGPINARLARNLSKNLNGPNRLLDALNGNTTTALNILTGREQMIERNNSITVAKTLIGKGIDFLESVAGVTLPFSEIPGDYLSNPMNPVNYREKVDPKTGQLASTSGLNKLWQDITGALGSIVGIQRRPKHSWHPSDLLVQHMGSGQKSRLYDSLSFNYYGPDYSTKGMSQSSSGVGKFFDGATSLVKRFLGEERGGKTYIGDDRNNDVLRSMSDFYDIAYKSPIYLSKMFDEKEGGGYYDGSFLFHQGKDIVWTNKTGSTGNDNNLFSSKDLNFRKNSILDKTKFILGLSPDGGGGLDHVSNAINSTSKKFDDGQKIMSKGSAVKILKDKNSAIVGAEYGRVWTKVDKYDSLNKTMKRGPNHRLFDGSVMGGKSRPWNLNIAPMSNGGKSFEGSTNIFERTKDSGDFYAKKYMFSIENLAWKSSNIPGYTYSDLPYCERGNNGGRVMWFPPYGLTISEQNNAKWEENEFLGRPEPIFTYKNTTRNGQLKFKVVVDHPSILNLLIRDHFKGMNENDVDEHINAFFAGTEDFDFYELIKTYTTLDPDDIRLIKDYLNSGKNPQTIKQYKYTSIPVTENNPSNNGNKNNSNTVNYKGFFLFENDIPGVFSKKSPLSDSSYTSLYASYSGKSSDYEIKLESNLNELLIGNDKKTANYKHDRKVIFGTEEVKEADFQNAINEKVGSITNAFTKLQSDYNKYVDNMTKLIPLLRNGSVDNVEFVVEASTSEVGEDNPNFYLGLRRAHSVIQDIFERLKENSNVFPPILKWPSKATLASLEKNGTDLIKNEYPISGWGYENNKGKVIIKFKSYGESASSGEVSCKQELKTTFGLKKTSPIAFSCRKATLSFNYNINNSTPPPNKPPLTKIKIDIDDKKLVPNPKPPIDVMKRIIMKTLGECYYFKKMEDSDPFIYKSLSTKLKYFHPAFHSTTPEGLNSRLTFLLQCVRPGDTIPIAGISDSNDYNARNTSFGPPPICVLRIGDFYHSKIVIRDVNIDFEDGLWDMNPEGIGIQPMIANVNLSISFIGGQGLEKPVEKLQNALSSNFFANTEMYDERATITTETINGVEYNKFEKEFLEDLQKRANLDLNAKDTDPKANMKLGEKIGTPKVITEDGATGLTYTNILKEIPTKIQNYFKSYQTAYNEAIQKYTRSYTPLLFLKEYRTISGCTIQTDSTTKTLELFGEYPKGNDISTLYRDVKDKGIKKLLDIPSLSDWMGLTFLTPAQKVMSDNLLKSYLPYTILGKLDTMPEFKSIKDLEKARMDLVSTIDKLNYIVKYGFDGYVTGVTYNAVPLTDFNKADFYANYSSCIDFIDTQHKVLTADMTPQNYDGDIEFKVNMKALFYDKIDDLASRYTIIKDFYTGENDPLRGKIHEAFVNFGIKTNPRSYNLSAYPKLKTDKDVGYVTGTEVPVQDGTNGDGESLRKIMRDANNLETTLNFYKIKK